MLKSVIRANRLVFHKRLWHRLCLLSCGHHALVWPAKGKPEMVFCQKCKGKVKNWRME